MKMRTIFVISFYFLITLLPTSVNLYGNQKVSTTQKAVKVNLNTATSKELVALPGIGEKMAQRIIQFRTKHGKFKTIQELMKVKGIGEKSFKKLEKFLTVQGGK